MLQGSNFNFYSRSYPLSLTLDSSSVYKKISLLPFTKEISRLPFTKNWGCLPFSKKLGSSLIFKTIEVVFHLKKNWGRLPFSKKLRSSPFSKILRSSSIFKKKWGLLPFSKKIELSQGYIFFKSTNLIPYPGLKVRLFFHMFKIFLRAFAA